MKKIDWRVVIPYIAIPLVFVVCVVLYMNLGQTTKAKTEYFEIVNKFDNHEITEYNLNLTSGVLEYKVAGDDTTYEYTVPNVNLFVEDVHGKVMEYNRENPDAQIKVDYKSGSANLVGQFAPDRCRNGSLDAYYVLYVPQDEPVYAKRK